MQGVLLKNFDKKLVYKPGSRLLMIGNNGI